MSNPSEKSSDKIDRQKEKAISNAKAHLIDEGKRLRKRIDFGIQNLEQGNYQVLLNNELVENLPYCLEKLLEEENQEQAFGVLSKLSAVCTGEDVRLRKQAVNAVGQFFNRLQQMKDTLQLTQVIIRILADWMRVETEFDSTYENVCTQLLSWGKIRLRQGRFDGVDYVLMTFHHLESGFLQKSDTIVSYVREIQKQFAEEDIVENLMKMSFLDDDLGLLDDEKSHRIAGNILAQMGPNITEYLLDKLLVCEPKEKRFQLMRIITSRGGAISRQLVKRLQSEQPWYFTRNIVMMMSMIDDSESFPDIRKLLSHKDLRVQQQVVNYIEKKGGDRRKHYLIEALFLVQDKLKLKLIMALANMNDQEVVDVFIKLLSLRKHFTKTYNDELIIGLCIALEGTAQERVVIQLRELIKERESLRLAQDKVIVAAENTLNKLEPRLRRSFEKDDFDMDTVGGGDDEISFAASDDPLDLGEQIEQLLRQGQKRIAVEMLFEAAFSALQSGNVSTARRLRDKILQIDSSDRARVKELSKMIQKKGFGKTLSTSDSVLEELKQLLTEKEFDLLSDSLRSKKYDNDEIVVRYGNFDPCLYFIKSGNVNLTYTSGPYEKFLKRLRKGDVIGVTSFFFASVWSVSLIAQNDVELSYLEYDRFTKILEKCPDLEKKLYNYCVKKDQIPELLAMSGDERRQSPRFDVRRVISNTLLDRFGKVGETVFNTEMTGISEGGLSSMIRVSKRKNARDLLGRMITSQIETKPGGQVKCKGTIIGVKEQFDKDMYYSLHVKFETILPQKTIAAIVKHNK